MTRPLAVLVPSRGRPHSIDRLATAFADTHSGYADLVMIVDADEADAYYAESDRLGLLAEPWFEMIFQTPARLAPTINKWSYLMLKNTPDHTGSGPTRHVGFIGDDHIPRTPRWDERVVEALDNVGTGVVYTNDLVHGAGLATAMFYTGNIVRALHRMTPPGMVHLYLDNAAMDLGRAVGGLVYLDDVVIEHMHPLAGKGDWDDTYRAANDGAMYDADRARYEAWLGDGLAADAARVRGGA